MCQPDLLDCIHEMNVETDLTARGIAAATGKSEAYVLGYLSGRYSDPAAEDELGEYPSRREVEDFVMGRADGDAWRRATADGADIGAA